MKHIACHRAAKSLGSAAAVHNQRCVCARAADRLHKIACNRRAVLLAGRRGGSGSFHPARPPPPAAAAAVHCRRTPSGGPFQRAAHIPLHPIRAEGK